MRHYITRQRRGKGFSYQLDGQTLRDNEQLDRIKSLAIPPAWTDVQIAVSPRAKVQATGRDQADRLQTIYNPSFRARQERAKFERMLDFAASLPAARAKVDKDLSRRALDKRRVLAAVFRLLDTAYFRVGNPIYAKHHRSFGLTTLTRRHAEVKGDKIMFDFVGKSGQQQRKTLTDRRLARLMRQLDELPGDQIFSYFDKSGEVRQLTSGDVNDYIRRVTGGDFTAKDFRTWGGTLLATANLIKKPRPSDAKRRQKRVTACLKSVAKRLGNTPAVVRSAYVHPELLERYLTSDDLSQAKLRVDSQPVERFCRSEESCLLELFRPSSS
ncbi:MAG TPA: hypothetical protein VFG56_02760 [Candidatus Saccharimonadales bacterium]|nr:hypothetical protein [Candidatus Saccharimonadales bacterium]